MTIFRGTAEGLVGDGRGGGDREFPGSNIQVRFTVSEWFTAGNTARGVVGGGRTKVVVSTPGSPPACGYGFRQGMEFLVFSFERDGVLFTGSCTPTTSAAGAGGWLRVLRALRDGSSLPALFGFVGSVPYPGWPFAMTSSGIEVPAGLGHVKLQISSDGNSANPKVIESQADGAFAFAGPSPARYRLGAAIPSPFLIWFQEDNRRFESSIEVPKGKSCKVDIMLRK